MPLTNYTFQQLINFTRTTSGTFVGSNGLIQNTPASVNLLTFTQEFDNAAWNKNNTGAAIAPVVTANQGAAPDGTNTADRVQFSLNGGTATGDISQTFQSVTFTTAPSIFSVYLRSNTASSFNMQITNPDGTATNITVTPTWQRFNSTSSTAGGAINYAIRLRGGQSPANSNTADVLVWGAQVEAGSVPTDYTRNVGGLFPARFDYDPVTLAPRGILIEEQRTNLLTYSEQFDNAYWVKNAATVTANSTASPDGTTTADAFIPSTGNSAHNIYTSLLYTAAVHTLSVYAKASGYSWIRLGSMFTGSGVYFDVTNGVVGTASAGYTGTITPAGNGWYRCSVTFTATAAVDLPGLYASNSGSTISFAGDGTSGIFIWGAQLEVGAFATSYIPTVASQVTRTADQASIVAPMFAPWYNQSEGTFVVEYTRYQNVQFGVAIEVKETSISTANRLLVALPATADPRFQNYMGGTAVLETGTIFGVLAANTVVKSAVAYKSGDNAATRNGASPVTSATTFATQNYTNLQIGQTNNNVYGGVAPYAINGHIRRITFYPVRLSDLQLQALTQ